MIDLKSIESLLPCKLISSSVFLMTIIIYKNIVVASDEYDMIIQDLPAAKDFDHYLSALEEVVKFCTKHKHFVDLNLKFGLLMIEVNLRRILEWKGKKIPANIRDRFEKLFVKNDEVTDYFQSMVQKNRNDLEIAQNIILVELFYNITTWPRHPDKLTKHLLKQTIFYSLEELENIYGTWEKYRNNVENYDKMKPSPAESDQCLALLALNEPLNGTSHLICLIPHHCKQVILGGHEFGYGLSHRILFMVFARYSRRCVVFTEYRDKHRTNEFCRKSFSEVTYIASNSFKLPDLMCEQIALCSVLGHAHFLRNEWLNGLLRFQTTKGCFSENIPTGDFDDKQIRDDVVWKIIRLDTIMNDQCNVHLTAMAAGALSNALRYIIQTYY